MRIRGKRLERQGAVDEELDLGPEMAPQTGLAPKLDAQVGEGFALERRELAVDGLERLRQALRVRSDAHRGRPEIEVDAAVAEPGRELASR